jgi:hypothetical protein
MMEKRKAESEKAETGTRAQTFPLSAFPLSAFSLIPPYEELPPTYWEQHETTIVVASIAALILLSLGIWVGFRRKPVAAIPPEVQARRALEALLHRSEDAALLSEVSRLVRCYFTNAFELSSGEPTTAEFCRAILIDHKVGPKLSIETSSFLHRCDERRFSLPNSAPPLDAAARALELIKLAEARRELQAEPGK